MNWRISVALLTLLTVANAATLVDEGCSSNLASGPLEKLEVKINGKAIECGETDSLVKVGTPYIPKIRYIPKIPSSSLVENQMYTVAMIDPDAPSNSSPVQRSWLHFLAVNVKGSTLKNDLVSLSNLPHAVVKYNPPTPPVGSGLHRYIIYVLQQSGSLHPRHFDHRGQFDIDAFANANGLKAVASNMFKTEHKLTSADSNLY